MKLRSLIKAGLLCIALLTAATVHAQDSTNPKPSPSPSSVDVVYTGKLLGYFRVPSLQDFHATNGCPKYDETQVSPAARQFLGVRDHPDPKKTTIMVGTGDNFAPELEARVFDNPPASTNNGYPVGNKELFVGDNNHWEPYDTSNTTLKNRIAAGLGVIPNDNVACFLRRAKYDAIVPGKHDFYFGAERVRAFARFLAAKGSDDKQPDNYEPVQMLGANLVMRTEPIEDSPVSSKVKNDRDFGDWPKAYPVLNLGDGKSVYPWFTVVKIQLAELPPEVSFAWLIKRFVGDGRAVNTSREELKKLRQDLKDNIQMKRGDAKTPAELAQVELNENRRKALEESLNVVENKLDIGTGEFKWVKICPGTRPNDLPKSLDDCESTINPKLRIDGNKLVLDVYLKPKFYGRNKHFSTLMYGKNFGVCTPVPVDPAKDSKNTTGKGCVRFSTHTPFFYFPHEVAYDGPDGYTDPEPYVVKDNVAIFGVVDPGLGAQVGTLNFGWQHTAEPKLTTQLAVEDPAEALQEQLDYFNVQQPKFSGMKVLLAQMTPQHARALAARFPEFQIVVSAADADLATTNVDMTTTWTPTSSRAFLAVPTPYYNPALRKGFVHIGIINATSPTKSDWALTGIAQPGREVVQEEDKTNAVWTKIQSAVVGGCLPNGFKSNPNATYDHETYLKWLVLCSMQQYLGSDVAMIQSRDLFDFIPLLNPNPNPTPNQNQNQKYLLNRANVSDQGAAQDENLQQTIDRLIWKGDLVTLLYVPGKALKKALQQSDQYEAEEKSTLALSVDRGRKLETLGIRPGVNGEYFINDLPIDDDRVYAVATTDYIEAGDTDYPDLPKSARNPRTHPAAFNRELVSISSLVCRKLFSPNTWSQYCLGPVNGAQYIDDTMAQQVLPYPHESEISKLWTGTQIALPADRSPTNDPADGVEQRVWRRSFWGFSMKNLSFGFKDLDNNRTDDSVKDKFAGVPEINSKASRTISIGVDTRLSYFADHNEFFVESGVDYERQSQGDPVFATGISLNKNKLFADTGMVLWRRPGREFPNIGAVFSVHGETQVEQPFSAFKLNTSDVERIRITQKRGLLMLGRVGFRWQNRTNTFEMGGQAGRELRALRGYHFENPGGTDLECLVSSAKTLSDCIDDNSNQPKGLITASSIPRALLQSRPRAGMYWTHSLSFPLGSRLKYEVTQDADFFFVKFHLDTSVDTRFRYTSTNRLSFMIWPNFSIGPALDLFMYQNKVNRSFLFQRTLGIETKLNFDIFNRREKKAQVIPRE